MSSFTKHDQGKLRFGLIPPKVLEAFADVLTLGAKKYSASNWVKAPEWSRYVDAFERHFNAWKSGETSDPETGKPHLAHAMCCLAFLMELERLQLGKDDRITDASLRALAAEARAAEAAPLPKPCADNAHSEPDTFGKCVYCGHGVARRPL